MKLVASLIIFSVLLSLGCSNSNMNCSEFKEGKFTYFNKTKNQFNENIIAIRTINKQIFIDSEKGDTLTYTLKWTSNCEYELIVKNLNTNKEGFVKIGDTLHVTIEPIDDFTFNYTSKIKKNGLEQEFKGKMKKIK